MLVIHIISTDDTKEFSGIYDGLQSNENTTILINPKKSDCKKAIINEKERIVFIGHGTEWGLLNQRLDGYIVDSNSVQFLRDKDIIGIWCDASNFAFRYDLTGFFTSMFISNYHELVECGFDTFDDCESEIKRQNKIFASRINQLLSANTPSREWAGILFDSLDHEKRFVYYNYKALYSTEE
jgi:hypothetical protein